MTSDVTDVLAVNGSSGTSRAVPMPIARVAVLADKKLVDVALPTELPLREIIPAVRRLVGYDEAGDDDSAGPRPLSLAPIGGAPFSPDATLDTVGVVDGDLLALQPIPAGPSAPGIVEDVADAAVIFSESRMRPWGPAHIRRGARAGVLTLVLAVTAFGTAVWLATGALAPAFAVAVLGILTVLAAVVARSPRVKTELSVVALAPVAATSAMAVPGDLAAQLLLSAAAVTAWSLVCLLLATRAIAVFTAAAVIGTGLALAAAAEMWWALGLRAIGCGVIVVAILVTVRAPQLAAMFARLPLPTIPAPGDPAPAPPSVRVLAELPRRVRAADAYQTGLVAGAVVLAVAGSLGIVGDGPGPWGWYLVAAVAAGAVLRARVWDSAPCKAWLLAHPALLGLGLVTLFAVTGRHVVAVWVLAVLAVLVAAWVVVALNPAIAAAERYSLPMRRVVTFVAAALDASLLPIMAYLVGLFELVLNR